MATASLLVAWTGAEAAPATNLDIRGGSLSTALVELARQTDVDLLFDKRLVRGLRARPVHGRLTPEAALSQLLAGSGLGYRATTGGAYVLFVAPTPPVTEQGDGAVAELLVVGRRTQNVDIRRTPNDIQPYAILGRAEIAASGRMTIDEVLRAREPADTTAGGFRELRSSIDLRGFGDNSTLVLVDGRRMPFVPTVFGEVGQADINGIPLGAVERIEVLTTTAGGIYGPGAIGGVVNVVLRREYRGADLNLYAGASDRADAQHARLEGRIGFTPDNGSTDVMVFFAHARGAALRTGERDYMERAGRMRFANDPAAYIFNPPVRKGVSVVSLSGNLTLDPAYGGASLGAPYTFLPWNFKGTAAEAGASLVANAGKLPLQLTDDASGGRQYVTIAPTVTSGLLNVRREIGPKLEAFIDGIYAQSRGCYVGERGPFIVAQGAARPGNPFGQDVRLTFPVSFRKSETTQELELTRWTGGLIASLPAAWKASVDYTIADLAYRLDGTATDTGNALAVAVATGEAGLPGASAVLPFGSWDAVAAALPAYALATFEHINLKQESRASSLRLSGPLFALPGGLATATFLAERREDRTDDSSVARASDVIPAPLRVQKVRSLYAEVRAPLGGVDSDNPLLRGLEAQLALRRDRMTQIGPASVVSRSTAEQFSVSNDATTFTLGGRLFPSPNLLLRGSLATGERPPTLSDLQTLDGEALATDGPADPRRAGRPLGSEGSWLSRSGGSTRVGPAQARSFTLGAVINPTGDGRPRLSLDYSRIVISREAVPFPLTPTELLSAETAFPERVVRAALSASDVKDGLSAGRVVALDTSAINAGRTFVEVVDARLDWRLPPTSFGDFRIYGAVTWQPTFNRRLTRDDATIERVGHRDGPLEWRGNAGVEWVSGPTAVDINAQFYDRYRVSQADLGAAANAQEIRYQGSDHIPAQVYVDLNVRRKFTIAGGSATFSDVEARLSVQNLFDHSPPIVAPATAQGFSEYGDPRRRRIMLTIAAEF